VRRAALVAIVTLALVVTPFAAARADEAPITIAVAGDSTTAQQNSWRYDLPATITVNGGYAHAGYTSTQIRDHITSARSSLILVVKVGVNDFRYGTSVRTVIHNVWAIVAKGKTELVLISPIVPSNITSYGSHHYNRRALGVALNRALKATAAAHGWAYLDPDTAFRTSTGGYVTGTTRDGVHPDDAAYQDEAALFAAKIISMTTPEGTTP
jgi:hypothetical protein